MALKSFGKLREGVEDMHKKALPTHDLGLGVEVPDQLEKKEEKEMEKEDHQSALPVHPSDASPEAADSLDKVGARPVKPELDGKAAAEKKLVEAEKEEDAEEDEKMKKMVDEEMKDMEDEVSSELDKKDEKKEEKKEDEEDAKEMNEHLTSLTSGLTLSEDAQKRVAVLFETAVASAVEKQVSQTRKSLNEAYQAVAKKKIMKLYEGLVEKLENYLNYIVEEYMEENKLAIEKGLRTEIAETFMLKLKDLLSEHFVEVPTEKVDLVKDQQVKITSLEGELNEQINRNVEMKKELASFQKELSVKASCQDMTELDKEKFNKLIKNVSFDSKELFEEKLSIIKESYFGKTVKSSADIASSVVDEGGIEAKDEMVEDVMELYVQAISGSVKK
jgi:hypothetical protein